MICLGVLAFRVNAQDLPIKLFADADPTGQIPTPLQAASSWTQGQFARLNPTAVSSIEFAPEISSLRLSLNLSGDQSYELAIDHREVLCLGRVTFRGRVAEHPGSYMTLALSGGAVAGSVFVPGRGMFQIHPAGQGWQRITQLDGSQSPRCGVKDSLPYPALRSIDDNPVFVAAAARGSPTNSILDLLIVYTPAARDGAGGTEGMNALIDAAVAEANLAFANSRVNAELRLVHRAEVDYTEGEKMSDDLDRLEDDDRNSPLHSVRLLRGLHRADLVCLITERTGGPIGLANQMHEVELEFGEKAFSVVQRQYAISYQALAHEIGHNLGCQHDRETSPGGGAFEFSHAHRFEVDGTLYHTVMAYQPGLPIPYFSNPDVLFTGVPTGIPEAATNSANNALTINLSAATAARFDSVLPAGVPPQVALISPTNGAVFVVPTVIELAAEASDADGQVVEVEFYLNGSRVGELRTPPFTMLWTNTTTGTFSFRAEARDDAGWEVESSKATVNFIFAPPFLDVAESSRLEDGTFHVRVRGADGQAFRLDASADLNIWSQITTDSLIGDVFDFVDLQATNLPARFYRVLPVP